jgi:hypothetical protein
VPDPRAIARQALNLAALIGLAAVIAPGRPAIAGTCHEADRPVFGLSTGMSPELSPPPTDPFGAISRPSPVRIDPRCPSEDPDRGPTRSLILGDLSDSEAAEAPRLPSRGFLPADLERSRPLRLPDRIDRPPRAR